MSATAVTTAASELFDADFLARLERLRLVSRRMLPGAFKGEHRSRKRGSGVEFADYRPYVEGDSLRFVDWPAYSRFDKLLVRTFEEEEDLPIYLLLDCSESMAFEPGESSDDLAHTKFGMARRLVAAIAYVGLVNLDRVTLMLYRDRLFHQLPTLRGPTQIHRILATLEDLYGTGPTDLGEALRAFLSVPRRRGLVVVVSDLFDDGAIEAMARYGPGHDLLALRVLHDEESRPDFGPTRRRLRLVDQETGRERVLHIDRRLLDAYEEELAAREQTLIGVCKKNHWGFLRSSAGDEFDDVVQRIFRTGRLLR